MQTIVGQFSHKLFLWRSWPFDLRSRRFRQNVRMTFLPIVTTYVGCRPSSSFITKWAGLITQEQFDPESQHFKRTSITTYVYSLAGYDVTGYFRPTVIATNSRKCRHRRILVEFPQKGSTDDHRISQLYGNGLPQSHDGYDINSCFRSAAKCNQILHKSTHKRVHPAQSRTIRFRFDTSSPPIIQWMSA